MNLERISFKNVVEQYREELLAMVDGALSTEVFNDRERMRLKKYGVITRDRGGNPRNRNRLTDEARRILT